MTLEGRGIPGVALVQEDFEKHAKREAMLHGLAELGMIVLDDQATGGKLSNIADAKQAETATEAIIERVVSLLTGVPANG
ncbi:MAG: hypothetical protein HYX92_02080 [Chloroflexi bacterium]|nr:hypothetical protein [Chloroflexota bacterium]